VVVDNGSTDGTAELVRASHPGVQVVGLRRNRGGAARTVGARLVDSPCVAFSDDDSWWAPGALSRAVELPEWHPCWRPGCWSVPRGAWTRCASRWPTAPAIGSRSAGPPVLGFIACGAVVRRAAFLEVGGFDVRLGVGGEEELLSVDLAERGWRPAHLAAVAVHQPGTSSGILQAMLGLPWVLRERRPVPRELEAALRTLTH
jgi:GT2 family glycosyltransferase